MFTMINDGDQTIENLNNRIEWIERTLTDDEHFCRKDIDDIYDTAVRYVRSIEQNLQKKLEDLKVRLDQYREENLSLSQKNKEIFDNEIEKIDQCLASGEQTEGLPIYEDIDQCPNPSFSSIHSALHQLNQYEKQFLQRPTLIKRLPRLHLKEIDLDPCIILETEETSPKIVLTPSPLETKPRRYSFSRRLNSKSSEQIFKRSEDSPEIVSPIKLNKFEGLVLTHVCRYQHEPNRQLIMTCSADYIVLGKNQSKRLDRRSLTVIDRSNRTERAVRWKDVVIVSIGSIDHEKFYLFTEEHLIIFSLESFEQCSSLFLPVKQNNYVFSCVTGLIHENHLYYIHQNDQSHWILSMVDYGKSAWIRDFDLTEIFPDIQRCIHLSIDGRTLQFLVELHGSQYAVHFSAFDPFGALTSKSCVRLVYAERPSSICSIFVPTLKKSFIVVNDSSARIIHLLTAEKYLQSYPLLSYAICYVAKQNELLVVSSTDICSINLLTNDLFFSRFLRD